MASSRPRWLPKWSDRTSRPQNKDAIIEQLNNELAQAHVDLLQKSGNLEREHAASSQLEKQNADLVTQTAHLKAKVSDLEAQTKDLSALNGNLAAHQREIEAQKQHRGFVLVLIDADGDDYIFQERFLNKHEAGGKAAADALYAGLSKYLKDIKIDASDIMIRAYANFKGLQTACLKNGKMKAGTDFHQFAQGFTRRRALFDFVDVGPGKEQADNKIRESLNLFSNDRQCKHILLGLCHDSGYLPYLSNFASNESMRGRISLLAGETIKPQFKDLGFLKYPLKLPTIFAPVHRQVVAASISPKSIVTQKQASTTPAPQPSSSSSNSTVPAVQSNLNDGALTERLELVRDKSGKRVDKPLKVDAKSGYLHTLWQNRLCGYYYLRGVCDGRCGKNHTPGPLSAKEFDYLWFLYRQQLCYKTRKGKDCGDEKCIFGHENSPETVRQCELPASGDDGSQDHKWVYGGLLQTVS